MMMMLYWQKLRRGFAQIQRKLANSLLVSSSPSQGGTSASFSKLPQIEVIKIRVNLYPLFTHFWQVRPYWEGSILTGSLTVRNTFSFDDFPCIFRSTQLNCVFFLYFNWPFRFVEICPKTMSKTIYDKDGQAWKGFPLKMKRKTNIMQPSCVDLPIPLNLFLDICSMSFDL